MRLPQSDAITFRYADESSLPGLTNHLGSLQIEADPIAVKHVIFPPVSGAEETTGMTTLNGRLLAATAHPVAATWTPAAINREAKFDGFVIRSTTAMIPGESAVVIEVEVVNSAATRRRAEVAIRLSGRSRNTGPEGYLWRVPVVSTSVTTLNRPEGLDVVEAFDAGLNAVRFHNKAEPCCTIQGVIGRRARWDNGRVHVAADLGAGKSLRFHLLLVWGVALPKVASRYRVLADKPGRHFRAAEQYWAREYAAAHAAVDATLPAGAVAALPAPMRRLYDTTLITAVYLRRDYPSVCPGFYLTLFPRHGEGSFFLWDIGMAAPFMARLDPAGLKRMVATAAASIDLYAQQNMNAFTGKGGGWFYAANLWSLFRMAWFALAVTKDLAWLDAPLDGLRKGQTVLDLLTELSLAWSTSLPHNMARKAGEAFPPAGPLTTRTRSAEVIAPGTVTSSHASVLKAVALPVPGPGSRYPTRLPDCGDRGALLEGTTTYGHQVASMNAGHVWMMNCMASLHAARGREEESAKFKVLADGLAAEVLKLYRPADGFFSCGKPDGVVTPSRVSQDHLMVMNCMPQYLSAEVREGLVGSFVRELADDTWMRCVSPQDPDVTSGYRSDVTFVGCYAGWVALTAAGLCNIGHRKLAGTWLKKIAVVTRQGPIAQAYWSPNLKPKSAGGPQKSTDEMPQGTHWCEIGGVAFGSAILDGILGHGLRPV